MGHPDPMQADHQADPHQEEHDQYEHPLESDTTDDDAVDEYPEGKANYQDPSAETNNMMNQQQHPAAPPQEQPQPQPQPQMYPPPPPQQQQQQQQAHQGPVQFPPTRPPPPVPISPSPLNQQQFNNSSTTQGFPVQQPQTYQPAATVSSHIPKFNGTQAWSTGLFDCMEDPQNAFITAVFPCVTFGQIAEIIDQGHATCGTSGIMYGAMSLCVLLPCLLSCSYRTKLRNQYDLVEAPRPDWVTHYTFEWCALCQAYRELKNRGLDPSIGWQGNQMRRQRQPVMMAPMNQSMTQ